MAINCDNPAEHQTVKKTMDRNDGCSVDGEDGHADDELAGAVQLVAETQWNDELWCGNVKHSGAGFAK